MSNVVDIFDSQSNLWTVDALSEPRHAMGSCSFDNLVFFAGGVSGVGSKTVYSNVVDVYDVLRQQWSVHHLSKPRAYLAAAAFNGTVYFGGGYQDGHYYYSASAPTRYITSALSVISKRQVE